MATAKALPRVRARVGQSSRTLMRKIREFAVEIIFCLLGTILVWIAIDAFGGPDVVTDGDEVYDEELIAQ